ncbi:MAG TPA: SURF1 family protein [Allosphingosinicella sp.]|nr:SURF1 family protein [Allosphingosinicella sp.]
MRTARRPGLSRARGALTGGALLLAALFAALGIWQLERRLWKHALIEAVETRAHAAPVAAPGPSQWPGVSAADDEYRRVTITGRFRHDRETLVRAVSAQGSGYWVMTPLESSGISYLVNRGFVPPERRDGARRSAGNPVGPVSVTGLLRVSEPEGGFLRDNVPEADRWYSRDVAAIAAARGLGRTAPYFIDADAAPNAGGYPAGGLTVIRFPDNHLVYALTWFALAALSLWAASRLVAGPARREAMA